MNNTASQNNSSFTIVMSTYKRPQTVLRSIKSVCDQTHPLWQLFVVIDDVTTDYSEIITYCENNSKIRIVQNTNNIGKNKSLNKVLDVLNKENFTGYVVFLDDDDWLAENCLADFAYEIKKSPYLKWVVSQRTSSLTKKPFTSSPKKRNEFCYNKDVLLYKRFFGDATHCVHFPSSKKCRFSTHVKNAEEWIYFCQVSMITTFYFLEKTGTFSEGYNLEGLTRNYQNSFKNYLKILADIWYFKIFSIHVSIYLLGRFLKILRNTLFWNHNKIWM